MAVSNPDALTKAIEAIGAKYDADLFAYIGFMLEPDDEQVFAACRKRRRKRKNVLLILSTPGGSADAAYRIARCLQRAYDTNSGGIAKGGAFYLYVHDMCKSA